MKKGKNERRDVRIRGLVRAARAFRERAASGIPEGEKARFRADVRDIVDRVEEICKRYAIEPCDLPRPSRDSFRYLESLLAVPEGIAPPEEEKPGASDPRPPHGSAHAQEGEIQQPGGEKGQVLAAPSPPAESTAPPPPPSPIRIKRIVSSLEDCLETLAIPGLDAEREENLHKRAKRTAEAVETICKEKGTTPAGLPRRSALAYAMLKWLSLPENTAAYRSQVGLARDPLARASRVIWPGAGAPVQVLFTPGRHLWKARLRAGRPVWRLAVGFLAAGEKEMEDLAAKAAGGGRAPAEVQARLRAFVDSEDFQRPEEEIELHLESRGLDPRGRVWDLEKLFEGVNEAYFGGAMEKPKLGWGARPSSRVFGMYDFGRDIVTLSFLLDDPRIPEYVPAFVLFHELLHKKHGFVMRGGRRMKHRRKLAEEERRFREKEKAEAWLEALARGWDGRPPV